MSLEFGNTIELARSKTLAIKSGIHMVDLLVGIAMADSELTEHEVGVLRRLIPDATGYLLSVAKVEQAIFESVRRCQRDGVEQVLADAGCCLQVAGDLEMALRMAVEVATTEDGMGRAERDALGVVAAAAGVEKRHLDQMIRTRVEEGKRSRL